MSSSALRVLAGAGAVDGPVYVDDVLSTFLYDGNGSTQNIVNGLDLDGEGGLVWIKARNQSYSHFIFDTVRGTSSTLGSDTNSAAYTSSRISSFNNNGFSLATDSFANGSGNEYVAWSFRKQAGFFDIVNYTGTGDTTGGSPQWREIAHNLGTAPGMIIVKKTSGTGNWYVWHRGLADDSVYAAQSGFLNSDSDFGGYSGFQTNANQTATHFSLRQNTTGQTNDSGDTYVAYLFAHDAQDFGTDEDEAIIKCDTYTGNGSTTGPIIDLGFEPQWLLIKKSSGAAGWYMYDNMRGVATGGNDALIYANYANQEATNQNIVDFTSTGFQLVNADGDINANGATHIYMAIRRPHKPASEFAATTDLFGILNSIPANSASNGTVISTSNNIDMFIGNPDYSSGNSEYVSSRLQGGKSMRTDSTNAEFASGQFEFDYQNAFKQGIGNGTGFLAYSFTRAPGYHDVVCYNGTGSARTVAHNLGVAPEMIWVKQRESTDQWNVYAAPLGNDKKINLNADSAASTDSMWNNTTPSASTFSVDSTAGVNSSGKMLVAYLFASTPGISKVGSYTGTGSDLNVDCGFSAGARFVLIKRTDSSGGWLFWDSVRGIVAGNDPYLLLNSNAAEVTNTDYIDPLSSGFSVTSNGTTNVSSGTYIFLAIA